MVFFQTVKMLVCVAVSYAISWLPLHVITIVGSNDHRVRSTQYFQVLWIFSHWLAFTNCAIHPVNYFVMNREFRKRTKNLFFKCFCLTSKKQTVYLTRASENSSSFKTGRSSLNLRKETKC